MDDSVRRRLAEGLLPHKKSLKGEELREETRLCYVAITRARENLYLLSAKWYGDKERELSRFITILQGS
nr:3'-5' exonuclease [Alicyclobacillus sacchari]